MAGGGGRGGVGGAAGVGGGDGEPTPALGDPRARPRRVRYGAILSRNEVAERRRNEALLNIYK